MMISILCDGFFPVIPSIISPTILPPSKAGSGKTFINPRFIDIYAKISNKEELGAAVEEMMAHEGPFFLEASMTEQENVFPMIPAGKTLDDIIFE